MKLAVVWDVTSCSIMSEYYECLGDTFFLILQDKIMKHGNVGTVLPEYMVPQIKRQ
jgi:hypothetical protein